MGLIEIPGGMYEYEHDGPPGCWIVTESGAGGVMAAFDLGPDVSIGYAGTDMTQPPSAVRIDTPDGSWAEVTVDVNERPASGTTQAVTEGGPRPLWRMVEFAHDTWEAMASRAGSVSV